MTAPDQYFPDTAINASPGFAAYTVKTQQDYEDEQRNGMAGHFNIAELSFELIINAVTSWIEQWPIIGPALAALIDFMAQVRALFDQFCSFATGVPNVSGTTPQTIIDGLTAAHQTLLSNPFASHVLGLSNNTGNLATDGLQGLQTFGPLGSRSPLNPLNLAGQIPSHVIGVAPAGTITAATPNQVINPLFKETTAIGNESNGWVRDATTGYIGLGSALVSAPTVHELVGNQIPVTAGQTIDLSIHTKWEGLSYSGNDPIVLGVAEYQFNSVLGAAVEKSSAIVDTVASAAESSDWIPLSGSYTVPPGVDEIRVRLAVPTATAGSVWFDNGQVVKTDLVKDHVVPGIGTTIDNITAKLKGWEGSGYSHAQSGEALQSQANSTISNSVNVSSHATSIAGHQAQIDALWAAIESNPPDYPTVTDTFDRTASNLGADWEENYGSGGGSWDAANGKAQWTKYIGFPTQERAALCRWVGTPSGSSTDYQTVILVLKSGAEHNSFGGQPYNSVIGRCNSARTYFIEFMVGQNGGWLLKKTVNSSVTTLASGNTDPPGAGSALTLICGNKGSSTPRHFTVKIGSTILASGAYGDSTSQYGPDYRGYAFGSKATVSSNAQISPGSIDTFFGYDT